MTTKVSGTSLKRLVGARLLFVALCALTLGLAGYTSKAWGQATGFSNASLSGQWGFSTTGTAPQPDDDDGSTSGAVGIGIMTFDGNGNCTLRELNNVGGTSAYRNAIACTYLVNPDGSGVILPQYTGQPAPAQLAFVLFINPDGSGTVNELRFIRIDEEAVSGVAKPQNG